MSPAYDWRNLIAADPATRHKPTERSDFQREVLRLHQQGLQVRDLATPFGMDDADVPALIFGIDEEGRQ